MHIDLKKKIVEAAREWATEKGFNQSELARHAKINQGYLSNMLRDKFSIEVDGKPTELADKWFYTLARAIGYAVKKEYWSAVKTREFEMMIHELNVAKSDARVATIINNTGLGKTYTVDRFCLVNPQHTYKITVNSMHRVRDILRELAEQLGTSVRYNSLDTLILVAKKLKELKMQGYNPLIIIDEAENLKLPVIQMLKGLYDRIVDYASIVLIGTSQLTDSLHKMTVSNKNGAPQFYRRIKPGIRVIPAVNDFTPFFEKFHITDKGLQKLLKATCNNYGELHDYLEPALQEADENEKPLTENMFRIMYNLPNY